MTQLLTTSGVHQRDRAAYWRDAVSSSFVELDCTPLGNVNAFNGSVANRELWEGQLSQVVSDPQHVARSSACIRRSDSDVFLLSMQVSGIGIVSQFGREAILMPGDFALYDTVHPYHLHFDNPFSQIVMRIPRRLGLHYLPGIDRLTACRVNSTRGHARLVSRHLNEMYNILDEDSPEQDEIVLRCFLQLLGSAFDTTAGKSTTTTAKAGQLGRIKDFIRDNLTDPDLNPQTIAEAHGISARYLNTLFTAEGCSPNRWLWGQRLERCRELLTDPRHRGRMISEIAFANGFNDMAHFSRAFKKRFNQSPRSFRENIIN